MKICILSKPDKFGVKEMLGISEKLSNDIDFFSGNINDPFPEKLYSKNYDLLVSYISPWIIPEEVLRRTKKWNINFHPGPPEYPGIGCFNFAIHDFANNFGVTAHEMKAKVDTGAIIGVKRFKMTKNETVESLSKKTYEYLLDLYRDTINYIIKHGNIPESDEIWKRVPLKRSELEKLATVNIKMTKKEIEHVIRSTYFEGKPAPFIEIYGLRFEYNPKR